MKTAFLFPGQGAQYIGMGRELYEHFDIVRNIFDQADQILNEDFVDLIFHGTEEDIQKTENTQPGILMVSTAISGLLRSKGIVPAMTAGLSLGEYSALVAAGAISYEDALPLVRKRGQLMNDAVPAGKGAMAAVIALDADKLTACCRQAAAFGTVGIANYNCPGQLVLTGEAAAVQKASELAKEAGAKKVVPLKVSGPDCNKGSGHSGHNQCGSIACFLRRRCETVADSAGQSSGPLGRLHTIHAFLWDGYLPGVGPREDPDRVYETNRPVFCRLPYRGYGNTGAGTGRIGGERMNLTGKVALVTGASRGIGKACAIHLADLGARVVVNYAHNRAKAEQVVAEIREKGGEATAILADVSNQKDVEAMVKKAVETYGSLDILVNNAGINRDMLLLRMKEEDWDSVINTNLKGVFLVTKAAARYMMKQRQGRIINISSVIGIAGNAGQANYAASKAGVIGFSKSIARELASRNILVNMIAPGFIDTDMTEELNDQAKEIILSKIPLKRSGKPEDVAYLAGFLASGESSYLTGQVIHVDGGMIM